VRDELKKVKFSGIGALFLEHILNKLKRGIQQLTDKSLTAHFRHTEDLVEVLACLTLQELRETLQEKLDEGSLTLEEARPALLQRSDLPLEELNLTLTEL